mmetsp:Transcript_35935/g.56343  ORF Transcript_35935/g.56343 Transcript_35935/m.56343 type:complete len:221 (+) Transcript_35935:704-1366(+)
MLISHCESGSMNVLVISMYLLYWRWVSLPQRLYSLTASKNCGTSAIKHAVARGKLCMSMISSKSSTVSRQRLLEPSGACCESLVWRLLSNNAADFQGRFLFEAIALSISWCRRRSPRSFRAPKAVFFHKQEALHEALDLTMPTADSLLLWLEAVCISPLFSKTSNSSQTGITFLEDLKKANSPLQLALLEEELAFNRRDCAGGGRRGGDIIVRIDDGSII